MAKYQKVPSKPAPVELEIPDPKYYFPLGFDPARERMDPKKVKIKIIYF